MNQKLMGFVISLLFIMAIFSPVVSSRSLNHQKSVTVEVNKMDIHGIKKILTDLSYNDACKLKELLIELNGAIDRGDLSAIREYENRLNELGIFGITYQKIPTAKISSDAGDGDNISNSLCYFHAAGSGLIYFPFTLKVGEIIREAAKNATSFAEALAIAIAIVAIFAPILIATYLVPFRIAMPVGTVRLENGSASSFGLMGYKKVEVNESISPFDINLSWFSGITINIPFHIQNDTSDNFLFVSGFALSVREGEL